MDKNPRMTVPCIHFIVGCCWYGKNCKYAHENGDQINVAKMVSKVGPCRRFLSGKDCPYGQKYHFLHEDSVPSRKTRFCEEWEKTGSCLFGMACMYAHGQEELDGYKRGNRKTRFCINWEEMGTCRYGTSCNYAHGLEELRNFGSQLETHPKVVSGSRIQSLAAPRKGSNCGSAYEKDKKCLLKLENYNQLNGSAWEKNKKRLFKLKSFKQLNGIYADWIDEKEI